MDPEARKPRGMAYTGLGNGLSHIEFLAQKC